MDLLIAVSSHYAAKYAQSFMLSLSSDYLSIQSQATSYTEVCDGNFRITTGSGSGGFGFPPIVGLISVYASGSWLLALASDVRIVHTCFCSSWILKYLTSLTLC